MLFALAAAPQAFADNIAFEWDPGVRPTNSNFVSFHNAIGPVLADDFTSAATGLVTSVEWWGSKAASTQWEVTFHLDNNGEPAFTAPGGGISQHFLTATGTQIGNTGVFHYTANWTPMDVGLVQGGDYWFSVANSSNGWTWALPGVGPTVGTQQYLAVESVGGDPSVISGPHDGPWTRIDTTGFAFKINVEVPEPTSLALLGVGLAGLALVTRRRRKLG